MPRKKINKGEEYNKAFPKNLRYLFEEQRRTQLELAQYLGDKSRQAISCYCDGSSSPDWETLAKIAKFFNVSSDYLLGITDVKSADISQQWLVENTGITENNISFLSVCNIGAKYLSKHIDDMPLKESSDRANLDRLKTQKGFDIMLEIESKLKKSFYNVFPNTISEDDEKDYEAIAGDKALFVGTYCYVSLQMINDLIGIAYNDKSIIDDFIALLPETLYGSFTRTARDLDTNTAKKPESDITPNGMHTIPIDDYVRFMSSEIGRKISAHLLERYGYGNNRENPR